MGSLVTAVSGVAQVGHIKATAAAGQEPAFGTLLLSSQPYLDFTNFPNNVLSVPESNIRCLCWLYTQLFLSVIPRKLSQSGLFFIT